MEVTPLAGDSMGVRSLAVAVEAGDRTVVIDPGASLGPRRGGRQPHVEEYRALKPSRMSSTTGWREGTT